MRIHLAMMALALLAACDGLAPAGGGIDIAAGPEIAPGTVLPYGEAATVCGLPESAMGTAVANGSSYTLWDSGPGSTAPRTHYVTGLRGGCAVQFTAALAMFGDVGTHEVVRYNTSNAARPYSPTDIVYEQVKAAFCGVGQGQPCGDRIDALARQSTFVTAYATFGTNPEWVEIFIHDGALAASGVESN